MSRARAACARLDADILALERAPVELAPFERAPPKPAHAELALTQRRPGGASEAAGGEMAGGEFKSTGGESKREAKEEDKEEARAETKGGAKGEAKREAKDKAKGSVGGRSLHQRALTRTPPRLTPAGRDTRSSGKAATLEKADAKRGAATPEAAAPSVAARRVVLGEEAAALERRAHGAPNWSPKLAACESA